MGQLDIHVATTFPTLITTKFDFGLNKPHANNIPTTVLVLLEYQTPLCHSGAIPLSDDLLPDEEELLKTYIANISRFQQQEPLTQEALHDIAQQIGISEATLVRIHETAQDHLTRAQGYVSHHLWAEAIKEATACLQLEPLWPQACYTLAQGYQGRFLQQHQAEDAHQARRWAQQCLELQPDFKAAFQLLQSLQAPATRPRPMIRKGWLLGFLIGVGIVAGITLWPSKGTQPPAVVPGRVAQPLAATNLGEYTIPVQWPTNSGLKWLPHVSILNNYPDSSFYKLQGQLQNQLKQEIHTLTLDLKLFDGRNRLLKHLPSQKVLESHQPPLRPGDRVVLDVIESGLPEVRQVRYTIAHMQTEPAPTTYEVSQAVPLTWQIHKPTHVALKVRERSSRIHPNIFQKNQRTQDVVWEIHNTGKSTLESLKLELWGESNNHQGVVFYELGGKTIDHEYFYPLKNIPLRPGEFCLVRQILYVPPEYARYKLVVVDFK